ncbi:MAG: amidohydrolase [Chloroflexota bacterium]
MTAEPPIADPSATVLHDLLIRGCAVVDTSGARRVLPRQDVAVDGPLISAVGPSGSLGTGRRTIEASGRALLPGLVNCHTHSPMSLFRGTSDVLPLHPWLEWVGPRGSRYDEEDIYWGALLASCQMIGAGVTTFADMYIRQDVVARAVEVAGLRGFLSEGVMAGKLDGGLRGTVDEQLGRAEAFVRGWNGRADGRIIAGIAPHSVYTCDTGLLRELAELARSTGARLHIHISETEREVAECQALHGRRPPRLLADCGCFEVTALGAHCVHLDQADIALMAEFGVGVSHNPGSNLKLRSGLAPVPALLRAGVKVGLGTDSAGSNDSLDLWRDLYLAAVLHQWDDDAAPAWSALEMATSGGAAAIGLDAEIGTVEPGKRADLILIDLASPNLVPVTDVAFALAFAMRGDEVDTVLVDGKIVMEGRRLACDQAAALRECQARAERLFGAIPESIREMA